MEGTLTGGKKWASGRGTHSNSTTSFKYVSGSSLSSYYIEIGNLGFKPSIAIYWGENSNGRGVVFGMYNVNGNAYTSDPAVLYAFRYLDSNNTTYTYNIQGKFENDVLYLPIQTYEKDNVFNWIVYE